MNFANVHKLCKCRWAVGEYNPYTGVFSIKNEIVVLSSYRPIFTFDYLEDAAACASVIWDEVVLSQEVLYE